MQPGYLGLNASERLLVTCHERNRGPSKDDINPSPLTVCVSDLLRCPLQLYCPRVNICSAQHMKGESIFVVTLKCIKARD